jgi:arylsulfatase A-like enzyme
VRYLGTVLVLLFLAVPLPAGAQEARPNVLVIVTDDQRATGTFGVMPDLLSWLMGGGTTFTAAFSSTPLCCPSRATLFSGRYAHNHQVRTNSDALQLDQSGTVQRYLHEAGYRTAIFGKYMNSWPLDDPPPHFDVWATFSKGVPGGYYEGTWNVGGSLRTISTYSTDYISNRAVGFMRNREGTDDQPWLLYLTPFAPHMPAIAEPAYHDAPVPSWSRSPAMREADRRDKPPYVRARTVSVDTVRAMRLAQLRSLMSVDDMVGRVMRVLEALDEGSTLVLYLSDNGFHWGEHSLTGKGTPYTASIAVPLVARWPGHIAADVVDRRLASVVDIAPTILDAAGVAAGQVMDGHSLLQPSERTELLTEYWGGRGPTPIPPWASIRTRDYQYVEYYGEDGVTPVFREYYDLAVDRWQLVNLLHDGKPANPDLTAVKGLLTAAKACSGADCP